MANANIARGFLPYRHIDGSVWNGSGNIYYVPSSYATALYIGDPVDIKSGSNDAVGGIPSVVVGVTGSPLVGVVMGIVTGGKPNSTSQVTVTRDLPIYKPASTASYILVCDDPNVLYLIQDDASAQATAPINWAGKNANFVSGSGSNTTGYSGYQLQASSVALTSTLDLKIMRALDQEDNAIGTTANTNMNAKWLVKLNNSRNANLIAGIT